MPKLRFMTRYRGHENRLFARGPNWLQFTFPATRKCRRLSLVIWWPE